jgi:putative ABC transport system permease protein
MRLVPDRATLRALAKSPVFTVVAVLSLALAIGVTTTAYSIVDAVEHPPVIGDDPVHTLSIFPKGMDRDRHMHLRDMYAALYSHQDLFQSFAAESPEWTTVIANGQPVWAQVEQVSANYFDVLGVTPAIGQGFLPAGADQPAAAGALLGYSMWRRVYGGATPVRRLTITVGDETYPVVGVMPPEMDGGGNGSTSSFVWVRISRSGEERAEGVPFFVWALVRAKPGQDTGLIRRQLATIAKPFADQYGNWGGNPLRYDFASQVPRPGKVTEIHKSLAAAAFVVLLIACANVANLLVARVISRQRDIAVRMAVGASGYDVARYVVGEAAVLAAAGGAGGVLLSLWGMHFIEYQIGADVTGLSGLVPHLSWRVLLFSIGMSAGTVLLIAWGAVLRARRTNVNDAMKNGAGGTTHRSGRVYRWLVVAELAMSLVVLMGAALLLRAVTAVRGYDFGYDPTRVVFANINDPWPALRDSVQREARYAGILAGVRQIRGVRAAAWISAAGPEGEILTSDVGGAEPKQLFMRQYHVASPGLLSLLGVKIVKGRGFEAGDASSRGVAIVDDSTAAALWPHMSPIGHLVKLGTESGDAPWVRVIGVARTVSLSFEHDPDMGPLPTMYMAGAGRLGNTRALVIRTGADEGAAMLGVLRYLRTALPGPNAPHFRSWTEDFGQEIRERQSVAFLFQMIGLFALVLSTIGVYGTLAYTGAQRTREFAMRIALGAQPRDVRRLVVHEALLLVLGGTAVGGFVAMWTASSIRRMLYTVSPVDATALVTAEAILVLVSLAASLGPALRATRADPVELLRAT